MINTKALICRAKTLKIRQKDIADALGLQQSTVSQKINNVRPMLLKEAEVIGEMLDIGDIAFGHYFFCKTNNEDLDIMSESTDSLTDAETALLFLFRGLDELGQQIVVKLAGSMYQYRPTIKSNYKISIEIREAEHNAED